MYDVARYVEDEARLHQRFEKLTVDDLAGTECFLCIKGIWKEYTESYYQMDTYYRLFHMSFQKSLETSNIMLDDLFKHVVDKVEGLYTHWFLGELWNSVKTYIEDTYEG